MFSGIRFSPVRSAAKIVPMEAYRIKKFRIILSCLFYNCLFDLKLSSGNKYNVEITPIDTLAAFYVNRGHSLPVSKDVEYT